MIHAVKNLIIGYMVCILTVSVFASERETSLNFVRVPLREAIQAVAKVQHINVILSPQITGVVTMQFKHINVLTDFDMFLSAHGLATVKEGNIVFIAPYDELMYRKQLELKWHNILMDTAPLMVQCRAVHYAYAKDIAHLLKDGESSLLSKRGKVKVDVRTNTLCVQEIKTHMSLILKLINKLDIPVQQVMITARLAVVDSDYEHELGFNFSSRERKHEHKESALGSAVHLGINGYRMAIAHLPDLSLLDIKLTALENIGRAHLISKPSLFAASHELAFIETGEEVPYQEMSEGGTAIAFKKAVLGLKVRPEILPGNNVLLYLQITQDRPNSKIVQGVPSISTRQIVTSVLVPSGRTVILGGIYEMDDETGSRRIPFLSNLPILGPLLFQFNSLHRNKRELLVFVTPTIMPNYMKTHADK